MVGWICLFTLHTYSNLPVILSCIRAPAVCTTTNSAHLSKLPNHFENGVKSVLIGLLWLKASVILWLRSMSMFPRHTIWRGPGSQLSLHFVNSLQISNLTFHKLEFAVIILSVLDWKTCDNIFKHKEMSWLIIRWLTFFQENISLSRRSPGPLKYTRERFFEFNSKGRYISEESWDN